MNLIFLDINYWLLDHLKTNHYLICTVKQHILYIILQYNTWYIEILSIFGVYPYKYWSFKYILWIPILYIVFVFIFIFPFYKLSLPKIIEEKMSTHQKYPADSCLWQRKHPFYFNSFQQKCSLHVHLDSYLWRSVGRERWTCSKMIELAFGKQNLF